MRTFFGLLVIVMLAAGCYSASTPAKRGKLAGKVMLDGKPVANGNIRFIALEPSGINVLAKVTNGEYSLPEGQGPLKGKYRVEFSVPSATKKIRTKNPDNENEWLEEPVETLPPRYHRDSQLVLDYDPENPKPYDAELHSQ
jgi:hypothetical protein